MVFKSNIIFVLWTESLWYLISYDLFTLILWTESLWYLNLISYSVDWITLICKSNIIMICSPWFCGLNHYWYLNLIYLFTLILWTESHLIFKSNIIWFVHLDVDWITLIFKSNIIMLFTLILWTESLWYLNLIYSVDWITMVFKSNIIFCGLNHSI